MRLIDADIINWESIEEEYGRRTPAVVACQSLIQNAHTIDPVQHGKWITESIIPTFCSECGHVWEGLRYKGGNYCPNCGTKMDGDK